MRFFHATGLLQLDMHRSQPSLTRDTITLECVVAEGVGAELVVESKDGVAATMAVVRVNYTFL